MEFDGDFYQGTIPLLHPLKHRIEAYPPRIREKHNIADSRLIGGGEGQGEVLAGEEGIGGRGDQADRVGVDLVPAAA